MKKIWFITYAFVFLSLILPHSSFAKTVTRVDAYGPQLNAYFYDEEYLIHISHDGDDVTGQIWTEGGWSEAETIFTDDEFASEDDTTQVFGLQDNTIVLIQADQWLFYNSDQGFQHQTIGYFDDIRPWKDQLVLINCTGSTPDEASLWSVTGGLSTATELTGSICTEDLSWFAVKKDILIDYNSGTAYDLLNNFAVVATTDLSSLNYNEEDAQGVTPTVLQKKNGDMVVGYTPTDSSDVGDVDYLYGYAHEQRLWHPIVAPVDAGVADGELLRTENKKQIFMIGASEDEMTYYIYRWTSADGWILEKTYEFDEAATLLLPDQNSYESALYWAFWFNDSDTIKMYRWTDDDEYELLTSRDLTCNLECQFTFDVSAKGKLFFAWENSPALSAAAWKPGTETWEDLTLADGTNSGTISQTHITDTGRWIIHYELDNDKKIVRWKPDTGWDNPHTIQADGVYYDDDMLYLVDLDSTTHDLVVNHWIWSSASTKTEVTVEEISSFEEEVTFLYNHYIFLYYLTQDVERLLDDRAL